MGGCRPTRPAPAAASLPTKGMWRAPASAPVGCPATFGLPGKRATQQNAAVEGAVGIAHEEATE